MTLRVHGADAAIDPATYAAQVAVVSLKFGIRVKELKQSVVMRHAIVVHNPDIIVAQLDGLSHSVVKAARATKVRPGVVIAYGFVFDQELKRLVGIVGTCVVYYQDIQCGILLWGIRKVLCL